MVEELEIDVHTTADVSTTPPLGDMLQKLVLASIGAFVITRDEAESAIKKLMEQRALAQKNSDTLFADVVQRWREQRPLQRLDMSSENSFERFLNRLNIPSKRDIEDISTKIAQLSARVEALHAPPDKNIS